MSTTTINLESYRFSPSEAFLIMDFIPEEMDWFMQYLKDGSLPHRTNGDGDIYFNQSDLIEVLCSAWDDDEKPERLDQLPEYCDITADMDRIRSKTDQVQEELQSRLETAKLNGEL